MSKLQQYVQNAYQKNIADCTNEELYTALLNYTKEYSATKPVNDSKKKLYYISAEFLIGKLLSNNLINLGLYDDVKKELADAGKDLIEVEEVELEPSLGNGGLGRLAACFLDSIYDIDVPGYKTEKKNRLRLFDLDSVDSSLIEKGIDFDKTDIARNLTLFLYPDDSDKQGELLRIFQQYFMVSNGAQLIIDEAIEKGSNLHDLADYAVVQINDTHPSMVIPELIRLLTERGLEFDEAVNIVKSMTAYTNHTILAEALEKWPLEFLEEVVPHLVPIIKELDKRVKEVYKDPAVQIIDEHDRVHMAHMDIHYGYSVNGVAALHSKNLKNS